MEKTYPPGYIVGGSAATAEVVNINAAAEKRELTDAEFEAALPKPSGHKLLLALPDVDRTFKGTGIVKADSTVQAETVTSVVAAVLDMGPDAYKDTTRFPTGPWCSVGQYVLLRPYQGTRFMIGNKEFRIVNDDSIDGVVADPSSYRRV